MEKIKVIEAARLIKEMCSKRKSCCKGYERPRGTFKSYV